MRKGALAGRELAGVCLEFLPVVRTVVEVRKRGATVGRVMRRIRGELALLAIAPTKAQAADIVYRFVGLEEHIAIDDPQDRYWTYA